MTRLTRRPNGAGRPLAAGVSVADDTADADGADRAASALLAALAMPAILIGPDERIRATSPTALTIVRGNAVGLHYIAALRQPGLLDTIEASLRDGAMRTTALTVFETVADTTWHVTVSAPVIAQKRNVLLIFEDVSALDAATKMRRDFVANVSHELRTPLTAVLGFVETLTGAARDDPVARERFLGIIAREAGRMTQLVDDLLSLGRVEENERRRPTERVELGEVIDSVLATLEPVAAAQDVRLTVAGTRPRVVVPGDAGQLRQVVSNLVMNAIKYGGAGKDVQIELSLPGPDDMLRAEGVRLAVRDQGEGIAAHHLPRLTERFYRVDTHRSRDVGGTGLGLAIVKHIVSRHRGRLRVESAPGKGSTFTVILPLH